MTTDDRIERAKMLYERAVFGADDGALAIADRTLDAVEADLSLARGRIVHARFLDHRTEDPHELELFERARQLYRTLGSVRGQAEALCWIGIFHQIVRDDNEAAVPALERSRELAERAGDREVLSYVLRHLAIADHAAGRLDAARERLEESARLRREIGLMPGVAANLVGLAFIAVAQGRRDDAAALVEEATEIATASDAHGIMHQIEEARAAL